MVAYVYEKSFSQVSMSRLDFWDQWNARSSCRVSVVVFAFTPLACEQPGGDTGSAITEVVKKPRRDWIDSDRAERKAQDFGRSFSTRERGRGRHTQRIVGVDNLKSLIMCVCVCPPLTGRSSSGF